MHIIISKTAALISILVMSSTLAGQTWIKNPANGHYYAITTVMSWTAAEAQAVKWGGHLVTINNAAENAWVFSTFVAPLPTTYVSIGLRRVGVGVWKWVSGEASSYRNWTTSGGTRTYAVFSNDGKKNIATWAAEDNPHQAIVERSAPATFTAFGRGCASTTALPTISGTPPKLGQNFTVEIKGFLPKPQFGQLIFGVSNTKWGVIPLPMSLAVLGMGNCNLLVSLDASALIVTDAQGSFKTTMKVGSSTSLLGAEVFGQAWAPDPKSNLTGVAMTNGFKAVVGY